MNNVCFTLFTLFADFLTMDKYLLCSSNKELFLLPLFRYLPPGLISFRCWENTSPWRCGSWLVRKKGAHHRKGPTMCLLSAISSNSFCQLRKMGIIILLLQIGKQTQSGPGIWPKLPELKMRGVIYSESPWLKHSCAFSSMELFTTPLEKRCFWDDAITHLSLFPTPSLTVRLPDSAVHRYLEILIPCPSDLAYALPRLEDSLLKQPPLHWEIVTSLFSTGILGCGAPALTKSLCSCSLKQLTSP